MTYADGFEHMKVQDRWPREWRELCYEYGFKLIEELRASRLSVEEAQERAEDIRQERQQQIVRLLCGPKIVSRSSFFRLLPKRDGFKTDTEFGVRQKIRFSIK
jgi:hypothetical protein